MKEAHSLRQRDVEKMEHNIARLSGWPAWQGRYTAPVVDNLKAALAHINSITEPFKLIVSGQYVTIYTNESSVADNLVVACPFVMGTYVRQAVVDRPRDTVFLLEPKHQLRSYFKAQMFPVAKIATLRDFFAAQEGAITPSPAMQTFLKLKGRTWNDCHWIPDHYFVDYDNPAYATMLAMIMPRSFRKTVSIEKRINT
jgi:hypothetical protein